MSTEYETLISTLAKDVKLSQPDKEYTQAETLSNLEYNLALFNSSKNKLQAIFRHDFNKLYKLEEKLKAAKFENTIIYFTKKIDKLRPSVVEICLRLNEVNQSIERLEQHRTKLLKSEST